MSDGKGCRMQKRSHTVQFRNLFDASPESYSLERGKGTEDRTRRLETFVFDPTRGRAQCTRMYFLFLFAHHFHGTRSNDESVSRFSGRKPATILVFLLFFARRWREKKNLWGEFKIRFIIGFVICDLKWVNEIVWHRWLKCKEKFVTLHFRSINVKRRFSKTRSLKCSFDLQFFRKDQSINFQISQNPNSFPIQFPISQIRTNYQTEKI